MLGIAGGVHYAAHVRAPWPPGVRVREEPRQQKVEQPKSWTMKGYEITPLAAYQIRARVLHTEAYHFDRESDLSPVDWALGWRSMSDSAALKRLRISQGGRWYFYHWDADPPLAESDIIAHSANTHILPATPQVAREVKAVRAGDVIDARGYLVSIRGPDGYHWESSLSRTDTGAGSCEVFWVRSLEVEPR